MTPTLVRSVVVAAFGTLCAAIFGYLWVNSGGHVPGMTNSGYDVSLDVPSAGNVVYFSDVMVAGVKVGKVQSLSEQGDHAHIQISLDSAVAPLHQGASIQLRSKSLLEEGYLQITDGKGSAIPSGSQLPAGSAKAQVQLADVLKSLDPATRKNLSAALRSAGLSSAGTEQQVQDLALGLGDLGRKGYTVLDALAAQSGDLQKLVRTSTGVMAALDQRRAQLRSLIADGDVVTRVTAGQQDDVRSVVRALPGVLSAASAASGPLQQIGTALAPVATNLSAAAPDLTAALQLLPSAATSLRHMMPSLNSVLDEAPATLSLVPAFSSELNALLPSAGSILTDANPMLAYLAPYHRELGTFFANFAQTLSRGDANGKYFRILTVVNGQSYTGNPIATPIVGGGNDPMPRPGTLQHPATGYQGSYPHTTATR